MESKPPRLLFFATIVVFLVILGVGYVSCGSDLGDSIAINTQGQPTIGYSKARVHLVLFEEPKCINCKTFNEKVFPRIKKEFIDTNKITYTVIPVAFLPGSMPAAVALLCAYYLDPLYPNDALFFTYLDYMYAHQPDEGIDWASREKLLEFAKEASPAIDLEKLAQCIDREQYRVKILKNTEYGRKLMGGTIATPTLYVNGIMVEKLTYSEIQKLINEVSGKGS